MLFYYDIKSCHVQFNHIIILSNFNFLFRDNGIPSSKKNILAYMFYLHNNIFSYKVHYSIANMAKNPYI